MGTDAAYIVLTEACLSCPNVAYAGDSSVLLSGNVRAAVKNLFKNLAARIPLLPLQGGIDRVFRERGREKRRGFALSRRGKVVTGPPACGGADAVRTQGLEYTRQCVRAWGIAVPAGAL